ncbi:MAG TPA: hypothetical protein VFF36_18515, partial [Planctomycetota bacterium]|nr:hypothetical protein [Planctomycetota bacterium]
MGASDPHYFAWLTGAIGRFEREHGALSGLGQGRAGLDFWCLAEQRVTPAVARIHATLGTARTRLSLLDKFPSGPDVRPLDFNRPDELPRACCDVLTLLRASYFIADPARTLAGLRRMLRPGGLAIVDWLHGSSDAPVLGMPLDPRCGGEAAPSMSTYMDPIFLAEFPREFGGLIAHVNRPPSGVNVEQPGVPLGARARLRQLVNRRPRRDLTPGGYIHALRGDLGQRGRQLVEPSLLEQHSKVLF